MSATTEAAGTRGGEQVPWTEEFMPARLDDMAGNRTAAEQLLSWVKGSWQGRRKRRPRCSTARQAPERRCSVSIVARILDAELIEMNASDFRTEELVEKVAGGAATQASLFGKRAKIIFLDELDGLYGKGDGGGRGRDRRRHK